MDIEIIEYRGFGIIPRPLHLKNGTWTTVVHIQRGNTVRRFSASNTWETREQAIHHCTEFGRQIIDGEVPGCGVEYLP